MCVCSYCRNCDITFSDDTISDGTISDGSLQERKAVSLAVKMWQESDKMEDGGMADEEDIYAVHDDDSDTEDVAMVTGDDQQKSLMAHISGMSQ